MILSFCSWQLKGFEFIKAIHFDPEPFDMERDLITPTYKKKRPQLLKYYQVSLSLPNYDHLIYTDNTSELLSIIFSNMDAGL